MARGTPGFSGADLENVLNEAAILAARKNKERIEQKEIDEAMDKILMGLERENIVITSKERELLAYHEGGHAVVAAVLPNTDPIHKVTIVPRGQAMGATRQLPQQEKYIYPREYMLDRLTVMMGGRAAEEVVERTATRRRRRSQAGDRPCQEDGPGMGMSLKLGQMAVGDGRENVFLGYELAQKREYSEETARVADEEIKRILKESYDRAVDILQKHRDGLDRVARDLVAKEELTGREVLIRLHSAPLPRRPYRDPPSFPAPSGPCRSRNAT